MKRITLAAAAFLLLGCPSFAGDAEEGDEEEATEISDAEAEVRRGAGLQQGVRLKPVSFNNAPAKAKAQAAAPAKLKQAEEEAFAEGVAAPCLVEDLNWNPGKGGPATAVAGQALRAQRADTTTAYRVRAGQLGKRGNFGFASDITHADTFMRLSSKPCEVTLTRGPCEVDYGAVTLWYRTGGKPSTRAGDCVLPKAAGKYQGEDYWWLNVHTRGPCFGGRGWFGGGKTQDGECTRAIVYESDAPVGTPAAPTGGTGPAEGVDGSKDCWKAPSGRTCCKVMFSPVPAECQSR